MTTATGRWLLEWRAAKDNNIGVVGIAPGAKLWAIKYFDSTGTGSLSTVIQGIDYVTQHASEIDVADMSFGCENCNSQSLNTALDNAVGSRCYHWSQPRQ